MVSPESVGLYVLNCSSYKDEFLFFHNADSSSNGHQLVFISLQWGTWMNRMCDWAWAKQNRTVSGSQPGLDWALESPRKLFNIRMPRPHPRPFTWDSPQIWYQYILKLLGYSSAQPRWEQHCSRCSFLLMWANVTIGVCYSHSSQSWVTFNLLLRKIPSFFYEAIGPQFFIVHLIFFNTPIQLLHTDEIFSG